MAMANFALDALSDECQMNAVFFYSLVVVVIRIGVRFYFTHMFVVAATVVAQCDTEDTRPHS